MGNAMMETATNDNVNNAGKLFESSNPSYSLIEINHLKESASRNEEAFNEATAKGKCLFFHYKCDQVNDIGWGCGYRTLQTLCSWVDLRRCESKLSSFDNPPINIPTPSIQSFQRALAIMGDKPESFVGSKEWIGCIEASMCLDYFYGVSCKIIHITDGREIKKHLETLKEHFEKYGSPVMMGGNIDASSKGIFGVKLLPDKKFSLLVLDPHFVGTANTEAELRTSRWLDWKDSDHFLQSSFYNLCLPQIAAQKV